MTALPPNLVEALRDRYVLERELGRGGMATVYLARDLVRTREVALKVMRPEFSGLGVERFRREIMIAAGLQHPHILPIHDSGEAAGVLWYTMPFVAGKSLRERLLEEGQLGLPEALRIGTQLGAALQHAHDRGVVHRDVKPANILLAGENAYLADFGIARLAEADAEALTSTGLAVGTPAYMSPEQSAGQGRLDGRTDQYALACVLYEMLAGEPPYTGPTPQAIMAKQVTDPAPAVSRLRPGIPPGTDAAIRRGLAVVPGDRYPTIREFVIAVTKGTGGPVAETSERRRFRRKAGLLAALAALGVSGLALWQSIRPSAASSPEQPTLAVVPFTNLGPSEDRYFADGLSAEITSKLAGLKGIGVVSRSSAEQYRGTTKSAKEVGRELSADYLLEGSVRWERTPEGARRVRVTPELVRVRDDRQVWSESIEADATTAFAVQGAVAERVSSALGLALEPSERRRATAAPTQIPDAYDALLRGNDAYFNGRGETALRTALSHYERATHLDAGFAEAYAKQAVVHEALFGNNIDHTDNRLELAITAARRALGLDPKSADAHLALARVAWDRGDYPAARNEYGASFAVDPNNPETVRRLAFVKIAEGRWSDGIAELRSAAALDPRSPTGLTRLAYVLRLTRSFAEAQRVLDRAFELAPDDFDVWQGRAFLALTRDGDLPRAHALVSEGLRRAGIEQASFVELDGIALMAGDTAHREALDHLSPQGFTGDSAWYHFWKAEWWHWRGRPDLVRAHCDSARVLYERALRALPQDAETHHFLANVYAGLGRRADAIREAERALALVPESTDAITGAHFRWTLALILTRTGQLERAVDELKQLLAEPSVISKASLRVDPTWSALRTLPRFQALIEGGDTTKAVRREAD